MAFLPPLPSPMWSPSIPKASLVYISLYIIKSRKQGSPLMGWIVERGQRKNLTFDFLHYMNLFHMLPNLTSGDIP